LKLTSFVDISGKGVYKTTMLQLQILIEKLKDVTLPFLHLIDRIIPLPVPYGRYAVFTAIAIMILTFLMRTWSKLKPRPQIHKASLKGKGARKVQHEARTALRSGNLVQAADAYNSLGKTKKALELYEKAKAYKQMGELLIHMGRTDEAISLWERKGIYSLAAKKLAEARNFERAAMNYEKAGNKHQAAEMFEKAGKHEKAAEYFSKSGLHSKAAACFEKAGMILPAAQSFERFFREKVVRLHEKITSKEEKSIRNLAYKSGSYYLKAGKVEEAAEIFLKGGFNADAARAFEKTGDSDRAAKLFREAGLHDDAVRLLEAGGDSREASAMKAEALRAQGNPAGAARAYAEAEDYHQAADLYARAEMPAEAAEMLLKAGSYNDAAGLFAQAGNKAKAAWTYEQARDYDSALRLYGEIGDVNGMVRTLIAADRPFEAAQALLQQNRAPEAYKILEGIQPDHQDARQAALIMAKMQASQNRVDIAVSIIQRAIRGEPVGPETIDLYHALGTAFEQRGDYPLALDIYTKVMGENIAYKDVAVRHQSLRERLAHTTPAAPAPPPGVATPEGAEKTMVLPSDVGGARANPRYQIVSELGRGGMGVVYKAQDSVLDRPVAYKVLPPDLKHHKEVVSKFNKEATALAKLLHPNIVTVFDAGGIGGEYYFVMEFIDGRNLKEVVREKGAMPLPDILSLFRQLAEALNYAHSKGVAHRDIKTSNVMLQDDGQVKLMDFGLAKILEEAHSERTSISGTPFYMSPEQTMGKGVDHRTDIYSLGVMMYELATGRVPFPTGDIGYHHLHTEPEPPKNLKPDIPALLEAIILKCMKKKKEERYQSAAEIIEDLKKLG